MAERINSVTETQDRFTHSRSVGIARWYCVLAGERENYSILVLGHACPCVRNEFRLVLRSGTKINWN